MSNFDDMKLAVEALTGGKNTVIMDDMDMPSVMVRWEPQLISDLITGGSSAVHPGSIVNGNAKTMYVGKYLSTVVNNRAYSLPFQDPKAYVNFDSALTFCRNKMTTGGAWCLVPYSLWSEIALWCRKNGTLPRGNGNFGSDRTYTYEKGTPSMELDGSGRVQRTATGSGPATWNHNWLPDGIADLNGNVFEWCAGMRVKEGSIHVIPDANCMDPDISLDESSTHWKAINASGEYVSIGTSGSLKYNWLSSKLTLITGSVTDDSSLGRGTNYNSIAAASGLTVPEIAKAMLLYPDEPGGDYGNATHLATLAGERMAACGGYWNNTSISGVFYAHFGNTRHDLFGNVGFRSAFCEL